MRSLSSFLVSKNAVSPKVLQEVLLNQTIRGGDLGTNLLEMKAITEANLVRLTAQYYRLLIVSIQDIIVVPENVIGCISGELATKHKIVPFDLKDENIYIACFQPPGKADEALIKRVTGKIPRFFISSPLAISIALWVHYGVELSRRTAKIIGRIDAEEAPILNDLMSKIKEERKDLIKAIIERKWEVFPVIDEKQTAPISDSLEENGEEMGSEEHEDEMEEGDIFGKYIIIDRIGSKRVDTGKKEITATGIIKRASGVPEEKITVEREVAVEKIKPKLAGFPIPVIGIQTPSEVRRKIDEGKDANEIIDIVHDYAMQIFDFILIMRYRKGRFELYRATYSGWGFKIDDVQNKYIYSGQIPEKVIRELKPCYVSQESLDALSKFFEQFSWKGSSTGGILIPITIGGKVASLIYGDREERKIELDEIKDLLIICNKASEKLLQIILEKKAT